jgi:hypothetical protein
MTRAWRAWVALMDRREPATALALVRIFTSLVLLGEFVWIYQADLVEPLWSTFPSGFAASTGTWATSLGAFGVWALAEATR